MLPSLLSHCPLHSASAHLPHVNGGCQPVTNEPNLCYLAEDLCAAIRERQKSPQATCKVSSGQTRVTTHLPGAVSQRRQAID